MEQLRIVSVNVGAPEPIHHGDGNRMTGINKRPVQHPVYVGRSGLGEDTICDTDHHGGPDQAVYAYASGDYDWWADAMQRDIPPGSFGENLTIEGLPADMTAGDRLLIGNLILEVTAPRIPCGTLAARMGDIGFGLQFRRAERPGFYFRVLNEGEVLAGDAATLVENPQPGISMLELFRLSYELRPTSNQLRHALASPIAARMRAKFESRLAALENQDTPGEQA